MLGRFVSSMHVIDLTQDYIRYVIQQDRPALYEDSLPQLFEHYYQFWASRSSYFYKDESEIWHRNELVRDRLPFLEKKFSNKGLHLEQVEVVLFIGQGSSNGHAFLLDGKWTVWLPLETYSSLFAVDVFVSHEIAHALHYQRQPDFFFRNKEEKDNIFRQVITEGIATITSQHVLGVDDKCALWADYLPVEQIEHWYQECLLREPEIIKIVVENLKESDESLFSYTGSDDVLENRAGYYVALLLMRRVLKTQKLSVNDLFLIGRQKFFEVVKALLENQPA